MMDCCLASALSSLVTVCIGLMEGYALSMAYFGSRADTPLKSSLSGLIYSVFTSTCRSEQPWKPFVWFLGRHHLLSSHVYVALYSRFCVKLRIPVHKLYSSILQETHVPILVDSLWRRGDIPNFRPNFDWDTIKQSSRNPFLQHFESIHRTPRRLRFMKLRFDPNCTLCLSACFGTFLSCDLGTPKC